MVIIRYLDEDENLVEPLTCDERITLCNYYYRSVRPSDRTIDCTLMEYECLEYVRVLLVSIVISLVVVTMTHVFLLFSKKTKRFWSPLTLSPRM